jgi:hypothetical protein
LAVDSRSFLGPAQRNGGDVLTRSGSVAVHISRSKTAYWQQMVTESVPDTEPLAVVELPVHVGEVVMFAAPSCMEVKLSPAVHAGVSFDVTDPGPPEATVHPEMLNF